MTSKNFAPVEKSILGDFSAAKQNGTKLDMDHIFSELTDLRKGESRDDFKADLKQLNQDLHDKKLLPEFDVIDTSKTDPDKFDVWNNLLNKEALPSDLPGGDTPPSSSDDANQPSDEARAAQAAEQQANSDGGGGGGESGGGGGGDAGGGGGGSGGGGGGSFEGGGSGGGDSGNSAPVPLGNPADYTPVTDASIAAEDILPGNFGSRLLEELKLPVTAENLRFLNAWQKAEGGSADNPFNTTEDAPGATNFNSVGVKRYPTIAEGIDATARTLTNGNYGAILDALKQGDNAMKTAQAEATTPWGTGAGIIRVLQSEPAPAPATQVASAQSPSKTAHG